MSTFIPSLSYIEDISNAQNAVVTFTEDHNFTLGEIISLRVSRPYGMYEVNNISSRIIDLSSDTVTLELDTLGLTSFVYPPVGLVIQPAIAVPSASGIIPGEFTSTVTLQDAFDHVPGT